MKFNTKLAIALVAATTSVFGLASGAMAGEGGAAGAASFTIDATGQVTGVAVASAIGKNGASANAYNTGTTNTAGALGSAGVVTLDVTYATGFKINDTAEANGNLATDQGNNFAATTTISIGSATGSDIVTIKKP